MFLLSFSTCDNQQSNGSSSDLPLCMQGIVDQILSEPVRVPPAKVYSYDYMNQRVYYIPPYQSDFFSELYTEDCGLLCHPDGGFTGMGDGACPDFFAQRTNEVLEWADPRIK